MSYFEDVYLKRMNKEGVTQQERVKTRKEKEFDMLFLKKTEYQANIYQINEEESDVICSIQPNKWNESQLISNLLISTMAAPLKTGDILRIFQKIKEVEYDKIWLVIFCEENITKGYQSYKVICLDSEINITNEYGDTMYSIPVKMVSASGSLVKDYFSFTTRNSTNSDNIKKAVIKNYALAGNLFIKHLLGIGENKIISDYELTKA